MNNQNKRIFSNEEIKLLLELENEANNSLIAFQKAKTGWNAESIQLSQNEICFYKRLAKWLKNHRENK